VWNLVAHIPGGTYADGVKEEGAEENIWTYVGRDKRGVEKTS
jgi:hypothetical protein